MNQRESESTRMPRAAARRPVRRPQIGLERLESRAMLTSIYPVPDWGGALPESLPVEVDELDVTAFVEEVAWDEAVEIVPGPEVPSVEDDDQEFATPADDGTDDESITEPVSEPQSEGDGGTPVNVVLPRRWFCSIPKIVGHIRYDLGITFEGGFRLSHIRLLLEGDDVDAAVTDVLSDLRSRINGPVVTKVFVSIPDGRGGQREYELDVPESRTIERGVGDTPSDTPPFTEPDTIESFDTDTAGTASKTDWTETDWTETATDWVESETSLAVRPTVVRLDALSLRSPAAAYFAALAGLPSQVSEAASVTAVGAKRRGR